MLGRMKGQSQTMYKAADKVCKKEFRVEFGIPFGFNTVEWKFNGDEVWITDASDDDYEITSGEFAFSPKGPCKGLTEADFGKPVQLRFIAGKARLPFDTKGMNCARALSFKARYK